MSVKIIQTCEMCGRARKLNQNEFEKETGGWRTLTSLATEITLCPFCIKNIVNHAVSRAHSRASNIEFPPDIKFWEAQESERIV